MILGTLCFNNPNYSDLIDSTNEELAKFLTWSQSNRLSIHSGKTKCMLFSNKSLDPPSFHIKIDNS